MKYWVFILLLLPALILGACGKDVEDPEPNGSDIVDDDPPSGPFSVKVATYNVLKPGGRIEEMSLAKAEVQKALGDAIIGTGASLIGFNELDSDCLSNGRYPLAEICSSLPVNWKWSLNWPNDIHADYTVGYSYSNGFAYDRLVLYLEDSGYVWLSKEQDLWYTDSKKAYLNVGSPERTCVWARFRHQETGGRFYFFVSHMPTEKQGGGENMAAVLNRFTKEKAGNLPMVLCGDMNSAPGANEAVYNKLKTCWTDAYETVGKAGALGTYSTYSGTLSGSSSSYHYSLETFTKGHPERRIDHIFTQGECTARSYATVKTTYSASDGVRCPSDHLPVVVDIDF